MNKVQKTVLHPDGDTSIDLYPKTSSDQVVDLVEFLNAQGLNPKPFVVGVVETLPAGSQANVTFTESNDKIAVNFYLPRGMTGQQGLQGNDGPVGPSGPRGPAGNSFEIKLQVNQASDLPAASSAYLGWAAYVGTENPKDVWACVEIADGIIAWENQGLLQGPDGPEGNGVSSIYLVGHTTEGNETVNKIEVAYTKQNSQQFDVHAVNGVDGKNGLDGLDGRDGTKWVTSSGPPSTTSGYNIGDFHLNTVNGNYYQLNGVMEWELKGNLTGPAGQSGIGHLYRHHIRLSAVSTGSGSTSGTNIYITLYNNNASEITNLIQIGTYYPGVYIPATGVVQYQNVYCPLSSIRCTSSGTLYYVFYYKDVPSPSMTQASANTTIISDKVMMLV